MCTRRATPLTPHHARTLAHTQGSEFKGEVNTMLAELGIKHVRGVAYTPQGQGHVEGANSGLKRMMYSIQEGLPGEYLSSSLAKAVKAWNTSVDGIRGLPPADLARDDVPADVLKAVRARMRKRVDARATASFHTPLKPGDHVLLAQEVMDSKVADKLKKGVWKGSHEPTFGSTVFVVVSYSEATDSVRVRGVDAPIPRGLCAKLEGYGATDAQKAALVTTDDKPAETARWIAKAQRIREEQ